MIQFRSLSIQGFKSFTKDQLFRFPESEGFYLLTGSNEVEPDLGANGVGKSSLWDALVWVLYGKTTRGAKASTVANREGQFLTSVCLEFMRGEIRYTVTRTWNPNACILDQQGCEPRPVQQEELDALIGVGHAGFLYAAVFGQFNSTFFDLSPTEKLTVLSEFLDLAQWQAASDRAKEQVKAAQAGLAEGERSVAQAEGKAEALRDAIDNAKRASALFAAECQRAREELEGRMPVVRATVTQTEKTLAKAETLLEAATDEVRSCEQAMVALDDERSELRVAVAKAESAAGVCADAEQELRRKAERLKEMDEPCPTCLQEVGEAHKRAALGELKRQLADSVATRRDVVSSLEAHQEKLRKVEDRLRLARREYSAHVENQTAWTATRNSTARKLAERRADRTNLERALEQESRRVDPHQLTASRSAGELESVEGLLRDTRAMLTKERARLESLEYWAARFKDVRLWVVEQALTELEVHINNALEELGLHGYKIRFDIERPRSDGQGVIRGFQVLITTPLHSEPIPWEAWSGGETQRLRLAGAVGIADLISARRGFAANLEVWDEPTAHLSQEGIDDLLTFLSTRARTRGTQVWLVDHRTLNAGDFDGEARVVKTPVGSVIRQQRQARSTNFFHDEAVAETRTRIRTKT